MPFPSNDPGIRRALECCLQAHDGQTDADGLPYAMHPLTVALSVAHFGRDAIIVALLHDVVEDTDMTFDDIENIGVSGEAIASLHLLTRPKGVPYADYIENIIGNNIACAVKLADIADNRREGAGFKQSLQARYDAAELAIRASLVARGWEKPTDGEPELENVPNDTPYGIVVNDMAQSLFAAAKSTLALTDEMREAALADALFDENAPSRILAMLTIATESVSRTFAETVIAKLNESDIDVINMRIVLEADTPVSQVIAELADIGEHLRR